jgi:glycosyltransferase involved in cell wall biosynthesis
MPALPLTVVIPTLNEARNIADLIESLRWADDVIVADGGSSDETVAIATRLGARVLELKGRTLGAQRNAGIAAARHPWVLALDADERVTDALREELAGVIAAPAHEAYRIRFANIYLGRERTRGRWGRDWHVRLFKRERRFADSKIHPDLEPIADVGSLRGTIRHVPYRDLTHHLEKMIAYARWGAEELHARGRHASLWDLVMRPWWRFVRDYFIYGSVLDGRYGFVASALTAYSAFLKYAYLWDMTERPAAG